MGKLGDTLRERRQFLGLTVEQAETGTRIRGKLLDALENGDYDRLPNPGYVRGYISSYARYLDLESAPLLAMYRAETGAMRFHDLDLPATDEAVAPRHQQHAVPWRAAFSIALSLAVLSLAVWGVTRLVRKPETLPPVPTPAKQTSSTVSPSAEQTGSATGSSAGSATGGQKGTGSGTAVQQEPSPATTEQPFTLKVAVSSGGASWLRVSVDGKPAYEGTLTGGQSKTFEVAKTATVRIGKPSVVKVTKDGTKVTVPESGGISSVTIKATVAE